MIQVSSGVSSLYFRSSLRSSREERVVCEALSCLSSQHRTERPHGLDHVVTFSGKGKINAMLAESQVVTRLPAKDLERARRFYSEKLGLEPLEERPGGLCYRCGASYFALFESAGAASGDHTQMAWEVADIESVVAALRARGVVFEEYDLPGLKTVNGIADIEGNYASKGIGERGAWFKDSEGNLLGLGQPVRR